MRFIVLLLTLMTALAHTGTAVAQSTISAPVHFDDVYYSGDFANARSIETDFTSELGEQNYYYVSTTVGFGKGCTGQCIAYGGLQTDGLINGQWVGKMAIFSLWDAPSATPAEGAEKVQFDGEGTGYSLRIRYDWKPNTTYRFQFVFEGKTDLNTPQLSAYITDLSTNERTAFGSITLNGDHDTFAWAATFHERYKDAIDDCAVSAPSAWRIENVTGNNGKITFNKSSQVTSKAVGPAGCTSKIWQEPTTTGYRSVAGIDKASYETSKNTPITNQKTESKTSRIPMYISSFLGLIVVVLLIANFKKR